MKEDLSKVVVDEAAIRARVAQMADDIARDFRTSEKGVTIVCILSGSVIFLADLIRRLPMKMKIGLVTVSSYTGPTTQSKGPVLANSNLSEVKGRDVLLIDDILDTGGTLRLVQDEVKKAGAKNVRTAVLLRKPTKAPKDVAADYIGFDIEDDFVVGYGLDYNGLYRNLPYVAVLKPTMYKAETVRT